MANWCNTQYFFFGKEENVKSLKQAMERVISIDRSEHSDPQSFLGDPCWLGHLVSGVLLKAPETEEIPCRGTIDDPDNWDEGEVYGGGYFLTVNTYTAYEPCYLLMVQLAEKYRLKVFFYGEEPGYKLYVTNDAKHKFFNFDYYVQGNGWNETYSFNKLADIMREDYSVIVSPREMETIRKLKCLDMKIHKIQIVNDYGQAV